MDINNTYFFVNFCCDEGINSTLITSNSRFFNLSNTSEKIEKELNVKDVVIMNFIKLSYEEWLIMKGGSDES